MESWEKICVLHEDRPAVYTKVKYACSVMMRNRHHGDVSLGILVDALLTILEFCGDFHCQRNVLTMLLSNTYVKEFKHWLAKAWFSKRPQTLECFLNLNEFDNEAAFCEFLNIYNMELEMQFLVSQRCFSVRWNDVHLQHASTEVAWLHINCGTKTVFVTGVQKIPEELQDRMHFVVRSSEIKMVQIWNHVSDELGKQQAIKITTSKGKLFVVADPLMEDVTMFVNFIKYISGVSVEISNPDFESGFTATDCNGNSAFEPTRNDVRQSSRVAPEPSRIVFGQSSNFHTNQNEDAFVVEHQHFASEASRVNFRQSSKLASEPSQNDCGQSSKLASEPSKIDFGPSYKFPRNQTEDASEVQHQHLAQNSVFQVSSSQDDALKTLSNNQSEAMQIFSDSDNNEIEVCHHFKRDSTNESCNESDTPDEDHHEVSISVDRYPKNSCEEEINAQVNPMKGDVDDSLIVETHTKSLLSEESDMNPVDMELDNVVPIGNGPNFPEGNSSLQSIGADIETPLNTEQGNSLEHNSAETVQEFKNLKTHFKSKSRRGRKKGPIISRQRPMKSAAYIAKPRKAANEDSDKSDNDSPMTARRETRSFTQLLKEVLPSDNTEFKAPELPKVPKSRRQSTSRKRKSDGTHLLTEVETSPPNATVSSLPGAEDTSIESLPSKSMMLNSEDDSGPVSVVEDTLENTTKFPHPLSMPTLITPIATPVRELNDLLTQPDFNNIHEKLNEDVKSETPNIESYIPPGPPPAIPLDPNSFPRSSVSRDLNFGFPTKSKRLDVEDDADLKSDNGDNWDGTMDSSSDISYMDNAGSAVLLPMEDAGFPLTKGTSEASPNNLQRFSDICSTVEG